GQTRLDQFPLEPFEFGVGRFLGAFHERGVADHVGGQDRRQSPLNPMLRHGALRTARQDASPGQREAPDALWYGGPVGGPQAAFVGPVAKRKGARLKSGRPGLGRKPTSWESPPG